MNSWKDANFAADDDVICTANCWLEEQDQWLLYSGIRALEKCWTKCILVSGVYVQKYQNMM